MPITRFIQLLRLIFWVSVFLAPGGRDSEAGFLDLSKPFSYHPSFSFVATGMNQFLVLWIDAEYGDIWCRRVSAENGEPMEEFPIHIYGKYVGYPGKLGTGPSVAFDGGNYLAVWASYPTGKASMTIFGVRIGSDGKVKDPDWIEISSSTSENQINPSVVFKDGNFFVVWEVESCADGGGIYGARISQDGKVLDSQRIPISGPGPSSPYRCPHRATIASDGKEVLVAWDALDARHRRKVVGKRLNPQGAQIDGEAFAISEGEGDQSRVNLSYGGSEYLAVWNDTRSGTHFNVYGARVRSTGEVLDKSGIPISGQGKTDLIDEYNPTASFSCGSYKILWTELVQEDNQLKEVAVSPQGEVMGLPRSPVENQNGNMLSRGIAQNTNSELLVWEECETPFCVDSKLKGLYQRGNRGNTSCPQ